MLSICRRPSRKSMIIGLCSKYIVDRYIARHDRPFIAHTMQGLGLLFRYVTAVYTVSGQAGQLVRWHVRYCSKYVIGKYLYPHRPFITHHAGTRPVVPICHCRLHCIRPGRTVSALARSLGTVQNISQASICALLLLTLR